MRNALAPLVDAVALFMDNTRRRSARRRSRQVRPTLLQFHGSEDDAFCRSFGLPYIKAHADGRPARAERRDGAAAALSAARRASCSTAMRPASSGGTGQAFDWARLPTGLQQARSCSPAA